MITTSIAPIVSIKTYPAIFARDFFRLFDKPAIFAGASMKSHLTSHQANPHVGKDHVASSITDDVSVFVAPAFIKSNGECVHLLGDYQCPNKTRH